MTQGNRAKADHLLGATPPDEEFARSFLADPYQYCPMLHYYGKKADSLWPGQPAPLRGKRLLVLLHYLRDLVPFVQSLRAFGLGDGMGHFFYKSYPYPQRSAIDRWLQGQGFQSLPVDKIDRVLETIAGEQTAEPILVLEDGGICYRQSCENTSVCSNALSAQWSRPGAVSGI